MVAGLGAPLGTGLAASAPIAAAGQFRAVAYLRWRLFWNAFRRKGSRAELAARVVVLPVAALLVLAPAAGCFAFAYAAVSDGGLDSLEVLFTGVFALQMLVSINISPPSLSFTPESLVRFPLSFPRYVTICLFLGLLSTSTVVGTLCLLAAAMGVTAALPRLAPVAFAAAAALALGNMLFTRMLFAWVDRWLATRRARELFTLLVFAFSIGIQYVNVTINNFGQRDSHAQQRARIAAATGLYHRVQHSLIVLPPGLAGASIRSFSRGQAGVAALEIAGVLAYALLFLAVLARRLGREYRGENLFEGSVGGAPVTATPRASSGVREAQSGAREGRMGARETQPVLRACLRKEWIYVRRSPAQFYGVLAPLAMVFLFAGRIGSVSRTGMVFPVGAAYAILGIAALAYNVFGADAEGVQFYFLAPVAIGTVMLAKNLFGFAITALQLLLLYVLLIFTSGRPALSLTLSTICWVVFAALTNATIGNVRSVIAPKKIDPAKASRRQASTLSALISVGGILAVGAMGAGLLALAVKTGRPWLPVPILLVCDLGAFALYAAGLKRLSGLVMRHRETLLEELAKPSV